MPTSNERTPDPSESKHTTSTTNDIREILEKLSYASCSEGFVLHDPADVGIVPEEIDAAHTQILTLFNERISQTVNKSLGWWAADIAQGFVPLCSQCKRRATEQTFKGEQAQKNLHRPVNWGWYCKRHADEGRELEEEAMYG